MFAIEATWQAGKAPALDGFYRVKGESRRVEYDGPDLSRFRLGTPLAADALDKCHDMEIYVSECVELPGGKGYVCCGSGPLGGDGFFARLNPDGMLKWIVAMVDSNPIDTVDLAGMTATFVNEHCNSLVIDFDNPDFA
ncbi:hypothetical protein EV385_4325 [Krasilnikovia cinnamomea]|uniref:Uncharacterized protein n=1 Tax=Krasilnikovia cinnamomea TaxID=349313 RepID=A0A4Q7ZN59_9ACTN|nr:hypothetical protein [Krasilnikovia cinnamomea]RZU52462.1 hypothetical protein EV385_4325 [Krasilnikovia cinnamomea]